MAKSEQDIDSLLAEVARLKGELAEQTQKRTEAEEAFFAAAQASPFTGGGRAEEQPTGKTRSVRMCLNPAERDAKKLKWHEVDMPTFYYTINLPAGAGVDLKVNGDSLYHGETYELTMDELRDVKSRVARCWDHEKSIHGDNENKFRRPSNTYVQ